MLGGCGSGSGGYIDDLQVLYDFEIFKLLSYFILMYFLKKLVLNIFNYILSI